MTKKRSSLGSTTPDAKRKRLTRATETTEARDDRLQQACYSQSQRRANETAESRDNRLQQACYSQSQRCANETAESRDCRRQQDRHQHSQQNATQNLPWLKAAYSYCPTKDYSSSQGHHWQYGQHLSLLLCQEVARGDPRHVLHCLQGQATSTPSTT